MWWCHQGTCSGACCAFDFVQLSRVASAHRRHQRSHDISHVLHPSCHPRTAQAQAVAEAQGNGAAAAGAWCASTRDQQEQDSLLHAPTCLHCFPDLTRVAPALCSLAMHTHTQLPRLRLRPSQRSALPLHPHPTPPTLWLLPASCPRCVYGWFVGLLVGRLGAVCC